MATELRVGVVDSGHAPAQSPLVCASRRFWLEQEQLHEGEAQADRLGHGAAVIDSLIAQAGSPRLCVAQVFAERWTTSPLQIAAAIHWLIEQQVALINLSLGLRQDRPVLRAACAAAHEAGILLCAASPAQGAPVYPASYPGVLRITGDARCASGQWSWLDSAQADFGAAVAAGSGLAGASVACAALSGQILAYLHEHPAAGPGQVLDYLRHGAAFLGPERRSAQP
ncbi:peptidase S8 and S53 subtilisin kexin sedolisin [Pseudomonas cavernae]|uniref:Peptidase S8 and S53 subtilisin kexin sedolisin n=1 Tax=Pseudomonas cavernae TaxID=2320867 RepID=A0A385Z1I7_9PSED|nr:peptidase S8 and S53 subtilisin kexin sedolisin [Pseudomonas cavernae]AYC32926.1 peptidase S8 and S53 subtilisin kexin sedolisin [Pseudomonas cavernae]